MARVGKDLSGRSIPYLEAIEYRAISNIEARETVLELRVRKPDPARLAWAKETAAPANAKLRLSKPQVYAREAIGLAGFPDTVKVRIQAIRIGGLAVVSIPCEVFAETGLAIKSESPFPDTIVMELANGYHGYLPTEQQHEWGGYETWPARSAYLEVGAEKIIRNAALGLLEELKSAQ